MRSPVTVGKKVESGAASRSLRCSLCSAQRLCESGAGESEGDPLSRFMREHENRVCRGEQIYRDGDEFHALFAVRTGSFKTVLADADGLERVAGFSLSGDVIGMEGIDSGRHSGYAVALEDSSGCRLPWSLLEEASAQLQPVRRQLVRMLSREIRRRQELASLLGHPSAEQRFAGFLVALSARYAECGLDARRFRLPMSRPDIASYLGLTPETVSRYFSRFRERQLVAVRAREVELIAPAELAALARKDGAGCKAP